MNDVLCDIVEGHIATFLQPVEYNNLLLLNKDLYNNRNNNCWNYYFQDAFDKHVSFRLQGKDVQEWELKNTYDKKDKLCISKKKIHLLEKNQLQSKIPLWDYFFPRFHYRMKNERQLYVDKEQNVCQWFGYYFEIYFPIMIKYEDIQIGFCDDKDCSGKLPLIGWNNNSIGLHMDDSHVYYRTNKLKMHRIINIENETFFVGAGINFANNTFFFTINGRLVITIENPFDTVECWRPIFFSNLDNFQFIFNDGKKPFHYDLKN